MAKRDYEPKSRADLIKLFPAHAPLIRMYREDEWEIAYKDIKQSIETRAQESNKGLVGTVHNMLFPGPKMKFKNVSGLANSYKTGERGAKRRAGYDGKV